MNANCGLCRQPFKTGDKTVMLSGTAVHSVCPSSAAAVDRACEAIHAPARQPARALPAAVPKFDSQLEAVYYQHLLARKAIGEILRVDHHPEKLHLGGGRWYTPDFRIILPDNTVTFDEVKGGFAREAAMVRLDVAASAHPYRFRLVRLAKGSTTKTPRWDISVIDPR